MSKKTQPEVLDIGFDDVIRYIGDSTDMDVLKKIDKVLSGRIIYVVNLIPLKESDWV